MRIRLKNVLAGEAIDLTARLTTKHPLSSHGQPVLLIEEHGNQPISPFDWVVSEGEIIEATEEELEQFKLWLLPLE